jgi:hypothetical protein
MNEPRRVDLERRRCVGEELEMSPSNIETVLQDPTNPMLDEMSGIHIKVASGNELPTLVPEFDPKEVVSKGSVHSDDSVEAGRVWSLKDESRGSAGDMIAVEHLAVRRDGRRELERHCKLLEDDERIVGLCRVFSKLHHVAPQEVVQKVVILMDGSQLLEFREEAKSLRWVKEGVPDQRFKLKANGEGQRPELVYETSHEACESMAFCLDRSLSTYIHEQGFYTQVLRDIHE